MTKGKEKERQRGEKMKDKLYVCFKLSGMCRGMLEGAGAFRMICRYVLRY